MEGKEMTTLEEIKISPLKVLKKLVDSTYPHWQIKDKKEV